MLLTNSQLRSMNKLQIINQRSEQRYNLFLTYQKDMHIPSNNYDADEKSIIRLLINNEQ
jgi:arginyl-tRNA--protein-N-Asp/Glu arginylyltransferase